MRTFLITVTCLGRAYVYCRLLPEAADAAAWAIRKFPQRCAVSVLALTPPAPASRELL